MSQFQTKKLPEKPDDIAPDGSEIRLLTTLKGGSMVHCTLPVGAVTKPVVHQTVEELWYIIEGEGQVWRKQGEHEDVTDVHAGISLNIPLGTHFQFRTTGDIPLRFIIVTIPPWPNHNEAVLIDKGKWAFEN